MKLTIEIEMENAVFFEENPLTEVKRILGTCIPKIREQLNRPKSLCDAPEAADKLYDINGNCVGMVRLSDE